VNKVDFTNYYQISYAFLFRFFYFIMLFIFFYSIMLFIYECFVVHCYFNLNHVTPVTLLLNIQSITTDI